MFHLNKKRENYKKKQKNKYNTLSIILLLISFLLLLWIIIVIIGIGLIEMEHNWAFLSVEYWIYSWMTITIIFIILDIIIYLKMSSKEIEIPEFNEISKPEYIQGKRVFVYTHPKEIKGGIFSKTYINIDDENVLRLRTLMLPPGELWSKKDT